MREGLGAIRAFRVYGGPYIDVCAYPIPGKAKSMVVCRAFVAGVIAAGGTAKICSEIPAFLEPAAVSFFYGIRPPLSHLWQQCKAQRGDWMYCDNSYFDCARERQFRITKNAIQHTGIGESDGQRLAALGVTVKPMRDDGDTVIVASQSAEFMTTVAGDPGWLDRTTRRLREIHGATRVVVRGKYDSRPLAEDLKRASLLVTWSSAAAVTALLEGVRVLCDQQCCATYVGEDRARWAAVLADNQWTLDEMRSGLAWKALTA